MKGTSPYVGVYGQAAGPSIEGSSYGNAGVWGDTGGITVDTAVLGTADLGTAGAFINNSSPDAALYAENDSIVTPSYVFIAQGGTSASTSCSMR